MRDPQKGVRGIRATCMACSRDALELKVYRNEYKRSLEAGRLENTVGTQSDSVRVRKSNDATSHQHTNGNAKRSSFPELFSFSGPSRTPSTQHTPAEV